MHEDVNEERLMALAGKVMSDVAGAMGVLLAYIGDQTGVYRALSEMGPSSADAIAEKLGTDHRYVHEFLASNAANGYVDYDPATKRFSMTPEQAIVFSAEGHPACMQGFFQSVMSQMEAHEDAVETFRTGNGRAWSEQTPCCFCGTDRFFRPGYNTHLLDDWLPALDGVKDKLEAGAKVADIGCGHGSSTIIMARAFPNSTFYGFDFHEPSVEAARSHAKDAGVTNVEFHVTAAKDINGADFDFVCIFDALHDMGDPVGCAKHIRKIMKPDGTFMLVEPLAGDNTEDNFHPLGSIFYAYSTTVCTPASLAQEVGLGLGTQAGQKRLTDVLNQAGFGRVRRAHETMANMVLEVRN